MPVLGDRPGQPGHTGTCVRTEALHRRDARPSRPLRRRRQRVPLFGPGKSTWEDGGEEVSTAQVSRSRAGWGRQQGDSAFSQARGAGPLQCGHPGSGSAAHPPQMTCKHYGCKGQPTLPEP